MGKIISIGAVNVDTILYVEEFCGDDGEQIIKEKKVFSGGQAGNIAAGLGKLGKESVFFGNIGSDEHTLMLLKDFDDSKVNYTYAKKTDKPNNSVYSIVDNKGDRRMYAYNYIDFSIDDFSEELYEDTDFIIFSSIIKEDVLDIYVDIAKKARQKGIKIALDPGSILSRFGFDKLKDLLGLCDFIFPSLNEIQLIVWGIENISKLTSLVPNIIVTCGDEGVIFYKGDDKKIFSNPKQVKKVDTTGAGDCFTASFIFSIAEGKNQEEAIKFAMYAALLSLTKKGARSMPSLSEIKDFIITE